MSEKDQINSNGGFVFAVISLVFAAESSESWVDTRNPSQPLRVVQVLSWHTKSISASQSRPSPELTHEIHLSPSVVQVLSWHAKSISVVSQKQFSLDSQNLVFFAETTWDQIIDPDPSMTPRLIPLFWRHFRSDWANLTIAEMDFRPLILVFLRSSQQWRNDRKKISHWGETMCPKKKRAIWRNNERFVTQDPKSI